MLPLQRQTQQSHLCRQSKKPQKTHTTIPTKQKPPTKNTKHDPTHTHPRLFYHRHRSRSTRPRKYPHKKTPTQIQHTTQRRKKPLIHTTHQRTLPTPPHRPKKNQKRHTLRTIYISTRTRLPPPIPQKNLHHQNLQQNAKKTLPQTPHTPLRRTLHQPHHKNRLQQKNNTHQTNTHRTLPTNNQQTH